jgi:hypothetical protein
VASNSWTTLSPPSPVDSHEIDSDRSGCQQLEDEDFFPAGVLVPPPPKFNADRFLDLDHFVSDWYSRALRRMGEPSLSCAQPIAETYRLLLLPTWGAPVAARLQMSSVGAVIIAKELNGLGGYDPGTLSARTTKSVLASDRRKFAAAIAAAEFWRTPTMDYHRQVYDGTEWILEGRTGNRHHVVRRTSPETGAFRDLCLLVIRLAGVKPWL